MHLMRWRARVAPPHHGLAPLRISLNAGPCRARDGGMLVHDIDARRAPKLLVLTGGPGGGKTAVLEIVRKHFCEHVVVLPEAATIIFGGGFPRGVSAAARRAAQRAIFHVQLELEAMAIEEGRAPVVLCDRGTV